MAQTEDLSMYEIDKLLKRAEARLREAAALASSATELSNNTKIAQLKSEGLPQPYVKTKGDISQAEQKSLVHESQRNLVDNPRKIDDPILTREKKKEKAPTLSAWHDMPRTNLTPELKRDLQLLNMRSVLDPKRMYKKQGKLKIPEYSQVGTLIEGPTEFFSARINNKDRTQTFVEDAIAGEAENGRFKRKYSEVQEKNRSGKKAHYKALQARRKTGINKRYADPVR